MTSETLIAAHVIAVGGSVSRRDIELAFEMSEGAARAALKRLQYKGFVERTGPKKIAVYRHTGAPIPPRGVGATPCVGCGGARQGKDPLCAHCRGIERDLPADIQSFTGRVVRGGDAPTPWYGTAIEQALGWGCERA